MSHLETDNGDKKPVSNFIRNIITEDLAAGKNGGHVVTRFPPEPNGYLHIGHAKSICLNFTLAKDFGGRCHLRFDDTNPDKESIEYIESIKRDVKWLGFDWGEHLYFASDYFDKLYEFAIQLIKDGKAYVCHLKADEVRAYRGTLTEPGKHSPFRNRTVEENLDLFEQMRLGKFAEGECTLRAKIDMNSPNINLRDPAIYRIKKTHHHRTGDKWVIYPMYDYTHCISDALENITHSICTLEFEDHRPLYDWCLDQLPVPCHPQQIEFARLNLDFTMMSKRKLLGLVEEKHVAGWDDPRMPTISGMRRRGVLASSLRKFCEQIGVTKKGSCISVTTLETAIRDDLNEEAWRVFGVLDPLKVTITNYKDCGEEFEAPFHPSNESLKRKIPMASSVYIDRSDFMEAPPKDFYRLGPNREARLRFGYVIKCNEIIKDDTGKVVELKCTYDPHSHGGKTADGRKVKGIIHWVSALHAIDMEVRLYDRLYLCEDPSSLDDFKTDLNPNSLIMVTAKVEPSLARLGKEIPIDTRFQFERVGYFWADQEDAKSSKLIMNRIITLKDSWAKQNK